MKTLTRRLSLIGIAVVVAVSMTGCNAAKFTADNSTQKAVPPKSIVTQDGPVSVPDSVVFWQNLGDGSKVRCIWGEDRSGSYTGSISCDWEHVIPANSDVTSSNK